MNIKELRGFAKEQYEISERKPWIYNGKLADAKRLIKAFEANHTIDEEIEIYKSLRK